MERETELKAISNLDCGHSYYKTSFIQGFKYLNAPEFKCGALRQVYCSACLCKNQRFCKIELVLIFSPILAFTKDLVDGGCGHRSKLKHRPKSLTEAQRLAHWSLKCVCSHAMRFHMEIGSLLFGVLISNPMQPALSTTFSC